MKAKHIASLGFICVVTLLACKKTVNTDVANYTAEPNLPATAYDYSVSTNDHLATLGRVLFYDKKLSRNNSVACANCHQQNKAFSDNLQFSVGLEDKLTSRNSPSIFAKNGRMFWDGRAANINDLVLKPIQNHVEMKISDLDALADKLGTISYYPELFKKAFGTNDITVPRLQTALTEFVRNFNFSNNKFNAVMNGQANFTALESLGKTVFFDKGRCANCHHIDQGGFGNGYGFTDQAFNIGLSENYDDNGLGTQSGHSADNGLFMVPALLNVEFTAPYMHDGRFKTLEEVIEHYNSGIKNHPNLDFSLRDFSVYENMSLAQILLMFDTNHNGDIDLEEMPAADPVRLNLTDQEKRGLIAFLKTLSDRNIFTDVRFGDPFIKKN